MNTIRIRDMTKREILIEFLNYNQFGTSKRIKDILEEFEQKRGERIPQSTGYRIVKRWRDEQKKIRADNLSTRVCDKFIEIFDS